jgi:hypothetical protein
MLIKALAGCAGTAPQSHPEQVSRTGPATRTVDMPSELEDCVTAVGADRAQCRAK